MLWQNFLFLWHFMEIYYLSSHVFSVELTIVHIFKSCDFWWIFQPSFLSGNINKTIIAISPVFMSVIFLFQQKKNALSFSFKIFTIICQHSLRGSIITFLFMKSCQKHMTIFAIHIFGNRRRGYLKIDGTSSNHKFILAEMKKKSDLHFADRHIFDTVLCMVV